MEQKVIARSEHASSANGALTRTQREHTLILLACSTDCSAWSDPGQARGIHTEFIVRCGGDWLHCDATPRSCADRGPDSLLNCIMCIACSQPSHGAMHSKLQSRRASLPGIDTIQIPAHPLPLLIHSRWTPPPMAQPASGRRGDLLIAAFMPHIQTRHLRPRLQYVPSCAVHRSVHDANTARSACCTTTHLFAPRRRAGPEA